MSNLVNFSNSKVLLKSRNPYNQNRFTSGTLMLGTRLKLKCLYFKIGHKILSGKHIAFSKVKLSYNGRKLDCFCEITSDELDAT